MSADPFAAVLGAHRGSRYRSELRAVRAPGSCPFFYTVRVTDTTLEVWMAPVGAEEHNLRENRDEADGGLGTPLFRWPLEDALATLADPAKSIGDSFPGLCRQGPCGDWFYSTGFDGQCFSQMLDFACEVLLGRLRHSARISEAAHAR